MLIERVLQMNKFTEMTGLPIGPLTQASSLLASWLKLEQRKEDEDRWRLEQQLLDTQSQNLIKVASKGPW